MSELKKTHPEIQLNLTRSSATSSPACGVGVLLFAETSKGNRIAACSMLEVPSCVRPNALSKSEVKARKRGVEVVGRLLKQISLGGAVDEYLADQLIIFMALATSGANPQIAIERGLTEKSQTKRRCEVLVGEVSLHTETAMRIAEMMLRNIVFSTEKVAGGGIMVVCEREVTSLRHAGG